MSARLSRRGLLLGLGAACAAAALETRSEKSVYLGDSRVRLVVDEVEIGRQRGLVYFHPHEDEHGSAVVTRHAIRQSGGKLLEIRSKGEKLISFRLKSRSYTFDPNLMFTDAGLERSMKDLGAFSQAAMDSVRVLRTAVLAQLGRGTSPIVCVHDNAEDGVDASSYQKGGPFEAQALKVAINPREKVHNFFLLLDEALFARLHHAGFNTVLQSPHPPDDGSLAILCQRRNWPYIRVEAAGSDMNQQERMLLALPSATA